MKFLEAYRKDIISILVSHNLSSNEFSFKKKKGRIFILLNQKDKWFSFYKKEDFFIDPETKKREDIGYFELKTTNSSTIKVNLWEEVIKKLHLWLNQVI